jgi:hypothetical protein
MRTTNLWQVQIGKGTSKLEHGQVVGLVQRHSTFERVHCSIGSFACVVDLRPLHTSVNQ